MPKIGTLSTLIFTAMLSPAGAPALAQTNPRYIRYGRAQFGNRSAVRSRCGAKSAACRDSRHPSAGEIFDLTLQREVNQELEAK